MLKLYGGTRTRSSTIQWYLEELGVAYEFVLLDMKAGEHKQPEFLAINPMGKVPVIVDGDVRLWESGAILTYLAEKHGQMPESVEARSQIHQWVYFGNATLAPGILVEASRERAVSELLPPLDRIFDRQPFLLGDDFTVADVAVGSMLTYLPLLKVDLRPYPAVRNYAKRLSQRPAFQKMNKGLR